MMLLYCYCIVILLLLVVIPFILRCICVAIVILRVASYVYRNATGEELLLNRLFRNYDPVARAVMDVRRTVVVSVDFLLLRIHGLVGIQYNNVHGVIINSLRIGRLYMYILGLLGVYNIAVLLAGRFASCWRTLFRADSLGRI